MAVEIIGRCSKVAREATCFGCGSILRYYRNDVKPETGTSFGETSTRHYITCAECKRGVYVKEWFH